MTTTTYDLGIAGRFRIMVHDIGIALQVPGILWTWETVRTFQDDVACRRFLFDYAMHKAARFFADELKVIAPSWRSLLKKETSLCDDDAAIVELTGLRAFDAPSIPTVPLTARALSMLPCNGCSRFGIGGCSAKLARPKHGNCKMRKEKI